MLHNSTITLPHGAAPINTDEGAQSPDGMMV